MLAQHCQSEPEAITLILGPRGSGKTALLKDFVARQHVMRDEFPSSSVLPPCYIDCGVTPVATPAELARVLLCLALAPALQDVLQADISPDMGMDVLLMLVPGMSLEELEASGVVYGAEAEIIARAALALASAPKHGGLRLANVLTAYSAVLDVFRSVCWGDAPAPERGCPVLIIDEASMLMGWSESHPRELEALVRFMEAATKQDHHLHVLLAASGYGFKQWLQRALMRGHLETQVVGDLVEGDAREFLNHRLRVLQGRRVAAMPDSHGTGSDTEAAVWDMEAAMSDTDVAVSDTHWADVYQVCGGNMGALRRAAHWRSVLGEWPAALKEVLRGLWASIEAAARRGNYYSPAAVKAILDSPHHALAVDEALCCELIGGRLEMDGLVAVGLLAARPFSRWAADIDAEAFGDERLLVVTAPTPAHLHLWRLNNGQLRPRP